MGWPHRGHPIPIREAGEPAPLYVPGVAAAYASTLAQRDIVFIDQRGTAFRKFLTHHPAACVSVYPYRVRSSCYDQAQIKHASSPPLAGASPDHVGHVFW